MPPALTPQTFIAKWRAVTLTERSAAQSHFLDLCHLLDVPAPTDADPTGTWYTFEKGTTRATPQGTRRGWADVWKRGAFAWEYKAPGRDLGAAYQQLLQYREALENPPLLVVSDLHAIQVHTNFTSSVKQVYTFTLADLLDPATLARLRAVWDAPESFRAAQTRAQVTEAAAIEFATLATSLSERWRHVVHPTQIAHFLIRLLFCLFAEDVGLLPDNLFRQLVESSRAAPERFLPRLRQLFEAMHTGGSFGLADIPHFDGGLFDGPDVIPVPNLRAVDLDTLAVIAHLDWSGVEPAILGTLFERSLDPVKRAQLGAHYTAEADILLIVEPVLLAPLRREWETVRAEVQALVAQDEATPEPEARQQRLVQAETRLDTFRQRLASVRVLDPACGSGNFLYVALKRLLDLEKEVITLMLEMGLPLKRPLVGPEQLWGLEVNEYAHELAQATIWIGYIQWLKENGFGRPPEPILRPIQTIARQDALLASDEAGQPVAPTWPEAEVVMGNPPFLGGKKLRTELGDAYVDRLFAVYAGRVPREADLVTYWFERARALIEAGTVQRAGLLATNSIRGGASRRVLERIQATGSIFMAWSDRPWVLDGAAVRVALVGFDDGSEAVRRLDGQPVAWINADLTGDHDLTQAARLPENVGLAFMGDTKGGAFDVLDEVAQRLLAERGNPNGRPNSDVVVPWVNGLDVTRRPRGMWIIDFGVDMSEGDAALYEQPFEYVRRQVQPVRATNNRAAYRERWWLHVEPRPALREALRGLPRYIATPTVAKHRLFVWLTPPTLPDHQLIAIARSDDYFLGVLHARPHELWALRQGTSLEDRPRYTPTTTFETYPFPWPPGTESAGDPRVIAIAEAARDLVTKRERWLNPEGASAADLKRRTLTNLYNERPTWLALAHERLDAAVLAAYGWEERLSDEEVLARLLALNLARAGQGAG